MTLPSDYLFTNHRKLREEWTEVTGMRNQDNECIYCTAVVTMICRQGGAFCSQRCEDASCVSPTRGTK